MKKLFISLIILIAVGFAAFFLVFRPSNDDSLTIVMNTRATDLSPYSLNLNNATRIGNIYEGLVTFDRSLGIDPALAASWGNIDETTWEFKLRRGVSFHDGSFLTAQDVIDSFNKAKETGNGQIGPYINSIKEVKVMDDSRIQIVTYAPDPLLLSKLTKIYIHKDNTVGTGPYKLEEWEQGRYLKLTRNEDYWGRLPLFKKVEYKVTGDKLQRKFDFENKETDILVAVPQDQALELPKDQVRTSYGLEVNFLMFKLDDPLFSDRSMREAIQTIIDPEKVVEIGNDFVRPASQFIAPGVFGYNDKIPFFEYSKEKEVTDIFGGRLERINFDYLSTYRTLSEYLVQQLNKAGFSANAKALKPEQLLEKISQNESSLFLIGWLAENGDAGGFFDSFIHSEGEYNNGRYKNEAVDQLIEASRIEMDPQKRLTLLQQISAKVNEDLIGIPLFETSRLYAVQEGIQWEPRLDGMVLASEVSR